MNINDLELKIYPLILEKHNSATLWHLCRTLDTNGSGKVSFTLSQLMEYLNCSKSSVYIHLKANLFNKVIKHRNTQLNCLIYTIYYKSLKQLKVLLDLPDLITCSYCFLPFIQHYMDKRRTATEVIAESLQSRSLYIAMKNGKQPSIILDNDIWSSEDNSISDNTQGIKRTSYGIFYHSDYYTPYGGSQQTIANSINRSRQTVNKRLKSKLKVQQFVTNDYLSAKYAESQFLDSEGWTNYTSANFFCRFGKVYKRYTNIYKCSFHLSRKKLQYSAPI